MRPRCLLEGRKKEILRETNFRHLEGSALSFSSTGCEEALKRGWKAWKLQLCVFLRSMLRMLWEAIADVPRYEMRGPGSPSLCVGNNATQLAPLFVFSVSYHELKVPYTVHVQ
jgi:hypothetical protein